MTAASWPAIPYDRFQTTGQSLHMWLQIVGKFRLLLTPWINHSWHAVFYVNERGLSTGPIPGDGVQYVGQFDFIDHRFELRSSTGQSIGFRLEPMPVAEFYRQFIGAVEGLGAPSNIHHAPNEVPEPVPFRDQTAPGAYDPMAAHDFWQALIRIDAVFSHFRTSFLGKVSPSHFFWGSFDLAVTRFSGRSAPLHPGGFPALPDPITQEAYSHEVSSAGFWPGGGGVDGACFYSYAYPVPAGFDTAKVEPAAAYFHESLGEFVLPYAAVREADDPAAMLMAFLRSTYNAAADLGDWDRDSLDAPLGERRVPRAVT
ncbi:MAG: hypothetical protein KI792_04495 [Alphaproteobacteria bacterium]|nr:hypothetical protein [Alphaproteobacteria bacterium SS10]